MNLVASLPLSHLTDFRFEIIKNNNLGILMYIYIYIQSFLAGAVLSP